jgi:hypothetical protein
MSKPLKFSEKQGHRRKGNYGNLIKNCWEKHEITKLGVGKFVLKFSKNCYEKHTWVDWINYHIPSSSAIMKINSPENAGKFLISPKKQMHIKFASLWPGIKTKRFVIIIYAIY